MENDLLTSELRGQRTLATVVFTDCVGFSARMSVDEDHTLDLIRRDLKYMKQLCGQYEGRVLKSTGDGLLMCFTSAVKAVECAMEIQKNLTEKAVTLPPEDALEHRIGIHLADMFITATDVMGNGVNIAARLQTEAEPGGICISQTVFDVIKASLHVESDYLGPRELKNIREVVPVYRILMSPESKVLNPHTVAIRNLEQSRSLLRVKKLLFYACKNSWESDHNKLNLINLSDQIQDVMLLAPTPERLRFFLDAAVRTLSKPAEYSLIANIIVKEISRIYPTEHDRDDDPTCYNLASEPPSPQTINTRYEQLATELEATGNGARIKKLAFYVCRQRWETDQSRLDNIRLQDLIAELHQSMPTVERLTIAVNGFVRTLSKQAEYTLLANALTSKLQSLYGVSTDSIVDTPQPPQALAPLEVAPIDPVTPPAVTEPYTSIARILEREPDRLRITKLLFYICSRQWESDAAKLESLDLVRLLQDVHQMTRTVEQLEAALHAVVKTLNKQGEYRTIAQTIVLRLGRLYPSDQEPAQPQSEPEQPSAANEPSLESVETEDEGARSTAAPEPPHHLQESPLSLFDFRLGIMKYTNPLQAKILLFSTLYDDFDFTSQAWSNLKRHDLDSLLRHLLSVCKTYTDLEACLFGTARRSSEPETTVQTAEAVIKCLRSFYLYSSAARLPANLSEPTQLKLDDFEETTLEFISITDEDDYTCQLLPPAAEPTGIFDSSLLKDSPLLPTTTIAESSDPTENTSTQLSSKPPVAQKAND
ncbi:MAG: adenylate/guanylate cyclase domain-containing protein [Tildeniella nuda ZEHNDER 1965/U140]|jgi:class 3 adenylate cyclase|nr:adenylate/guanylate cyclase domain-containing protein [Tildeniella nuda ZEHNDER 1965/U140]